MLNSPQDNHEDEKTLTYFCSGCNRECEVELKVRGEEILSVTGNTCSIGATHACSQFEQDMMARKQRAATTKD